MSIFNKETPEPTNSTAELTSTLATEIYEYIKSYNTFGDAWQGNGLYDYSNMKKVWNETERVIKNIDKYMTGGYVITPQEVDDDGNVVTEEVRSPTTKTNLKSTMSSDILNTDTIVDDYMDGKTITQFKTLYEDE